MKKRKNDSVFVEITNKEIYDKIVFVESRMTEKFDNVLARQDVTNGKVRMNTKLIWFLFGFIITVLGWFISHLLNS